jgi:hypothetical protein
MVFSRIKSILRKQGFEIYSKPYQLNIVGLRSRSTKANRFDDELHVFYKTDGVFWNYHMFKCTTDPGTYWLYNPSNPQGTLILAQGQYINAYAIGKHRGLYTALVEVGPVHYFRDYNRDNTLDFNNGIRYTGSAGVNIHRASINGTTKYIDEYSAGCQVLEDPEDFDLFMKLCARHAQLYGNLFTYTLIDFRAMRRETYKRIALAASALSAAFLGYFSFKN